MVTDLLVTEGLVVAVAAVAMTIAAAAAWHSNRVSIVDVAWGLALAAVGLTCALRDGWPTWVLAVTVSLWGLRLSGHIARRSEGKGEDPRYRELLGGQLRDVGMPRAIRQVFLVQGLAVCLVSLPLAVSAAFRPRSPALFWTGVGVALAGMLIEALGDAQLEAFKRDPNRGLVMDRGLWAWTRHPNYFGDALFWIGIWIAAALAAGWLPALVTIASPIAMTWFLAYVTGARLLEQTMMHRPGYREYAARTSMFVPLPPGRHARRTSGDGPLP